MFAIIYEPVRSICSDLIEGGVTHAVNTDHIEDIYFWGDAARICLVSGEHFDVTRPQAISILNVLDKWRGGVSNAIAEMEDEGRGYEKAKTEAANLKGGCAG